MNFERTWQLFLEAFERGGLVMWPILAVSVVIWFVGFDRLTTILWVRWVRRRFLARVRHFSSDGQLKSRTGGRAFNSFLAVLPDIQSGRRSLPFYHRELLLNVVPDLERGFSTMTAWIAVAPLLGLLGTVVGMVETFEVINLFGIGNPHLMAQGISVALLTTQAGLTVAFPALVFEVILVNQRKRLVRSLVTDEQAIARSLGLPAARRPDHG